MYRKEWLLEFARKRIKKDFADPAFKTAAEHFGVSKSTLSNALAGRYAVIPEFLLDYLGYEVAETVYKKVGK